MASKSTGLIRPDSGDAVKTFGLCGWFESLGHLANRGLRDDAIPFLVSLDADFRRDVEEERFQFAVEAAGKEHVGPALPAGQVRGVDVGHGAADGDALADQVADCRENSLVDGLICWIVRDEAADLVRGDGVDSELREVGGFAAAGQADCDDEFH